MRRSKILAAETAVERLGSLQLLERRDENRVTAETLKFDFQGAEAYTHRSIQPSTKNKPATVAAPVSCDQNRA